MGWIDDLLGIFWQQAGVDVSLRRTANLVGAVVADNPTEQRIDLYTSAGQFDWQDSVRLASAMAMPAASYNATTKRLTAVAVGALTLDGTAAAVGNRVLANHAADGVGPRPDWNGIYVVIDAGSGATPWILERAVFCADDGQATNGLTVFIGEGATLAKSTWALTTVDPITLGTTPITWEQVAGVGWTGLPPGAHDGQPLVWDAGGPSWAAGLFIAQGPAAATHGFVRLVANGMIGWPSTLAPGNDIVVAVDAADLLHIGYLPGVPYVYPTGIRINALADIILRAGGVQQLELDALHASVDGYLEVGSGGLIAPTGTIRCPTNTDIMARSGGGSMTMLTTTAIPGSVSVGDPTGGPATPTGVALGMLIGGGIYTAGVPTIEWDTTTIRQYEQILIGHIVAAPEAIRFVDTATSVRIDVQPLVAVAATGCATTIAGQDVDSGGGAASTAGPVTIRAGNGTQPIDNGHDLRLAAGVTAVGGAGVFGNIVLHKTVSPAWNSMEAGAFIANCRTAPVGNPVGGGYMYAVGGALTWRGSGGTVTVMGPAEPHCPQCGRDCAHSWRNDDAGWELEVCMWCMTEALGNAGVIRKTQR